MELSRKLLDLHAIPLPTKLASMLVEAFEVRKEYQLKGYAASCAAMVQLVQRLLLDAEVTNSTNADVPSSTTASVECQRIPITTNNTTDNTFSVEKTENENQQPEPTPDSSVGSKVKSNVPRPKPKISGGDKFSAPENWEVAPLQPYPYFLQWRALHYKNQGAHWANSPQSNAYAEFYKNRFKTNILWQEFLQFYDLALDNALALQSAGIEVKLPTCFEDRDVVSDRVV